MPRNKAVHAAAMPAHGVNQCLQRFIVAGAQSFEIMFCEIDKLIARSNGQGNEKQNEPATLFIFFDDEHDKNQIQWYPDKTVADPIHHNVEKIVVQAVEKEKQLAINLF